jgi:hypothetical protein
MTSLEHQLREDRALRDAAHALFKSDLALIRADLDQRGVGGRIADRVGDATMDMVDEAVDFAGENRSTLAATLAALVLWFARGPIMDGLAAVFTSEDEPEPEPDRLADRLRGWNPLGGSATNGRR